MAQPGTATPRGAPHEAFGPSGLGEAGLVPGAASPVAVGFPVGDRGGRSGASVRNARRLTYDPSNHPS